MKPPFHAEHIGSFVRPTRLIEAARARKANQIADADFTAAQDAAIRDIVAFQESIGLPSITDGEFRRRSWSAGFIDAVDGFGLRDGTLGFKDESGVVHEYAGLPSTRTTHAPHCSLPQPKRAALRPRSLRST